MSAKQKDYHNHSTSIEYLAHIPHICGIVSSPPSDYDVNCPNTTTPLLSLQDQLESHLALCHYHQLALIALSTHEQACESNENDWELGATLFTTHLQARGNDIIEKLNTAARQKQPTLKNDENND